MVPRKVVARQLRVWAQRLDPQPKPKPKIMVSGSNFYMNMTSGCQDSQVRWVDQDGKREPNA